jgi:Rod binding domain-containing protein
MTVISSMPGSSNGLNTNGLDTKGESKKIADTARQFEALLIGQMLRSARDPDGEGLMGTEDGPGSTLVEMGEQQFAQTLANNGGLGIAKMVIAGLESHANR